MFWRNRHQNLLPKIQGDRWQGLDYLNLNYLASAVPLETEHKQETGALVAATGARAQAQAAAHGARTRGTTLAGRQAWCLNEETALRSVPAFEEKGHCVLFFFCVCVNRASCTSAKETCSLPASLNRASTVRSPGQGQEQTSKGVLAPSSSSPTGNIHEHHHPHQFLFC